MSKSRSSAVAMAVGLAAVAFSAGSALAISQSGEQKDMRRVGHTDLQGRPAYHPNFIQYPDGRVIAFVGTHGGSKPNPLKPGSPVELNGTMIIDVTDPAHPVEEFHIPAPAAGAQTQSNRMCLGSDLPGGTSGHVYMMRNVQGSSASGYEVWDVTLVANPTLVGEMRSLRNTHKHWWECKTGIAYLPGSKGAPPLWRRGQSMLIVDWGTPSSPIYLRTHGLPGGQPSGTGPVPPSLHGPISAHEHPNAAGMLARGATSDAAIGNRLYLAYGVGDDGVLQVLDRKKLLPPLSGGRGGTWVGNPDDPTNAELESAQTSILYMSPDQGGHTSFPVFGLVPKSYQDFTEFLSRDIVLLASESTADNCREAPHWSFIVDVTVENSLAVPPGTRLQQNPWQGPMVLSTMSLDPRAGEKWPRGNYCTRGARFGVHSSEENFNNPYYGTLTFLAYFTGGVRAWDIREPQAPVEVGFYVPESNALTEPDGYMTNNLEVDNRGYIYAVDRNGAGLDILELHGKAKQIGLGQQ
ncbi:MAG: hypothetical protein WAP47_09960 [Candidatus Rokuibacteriota bacterium]